MKPLIEIRNAAFNRGVVPALVGVNWTVQPGEHWVVTGRIGAGKTTLIQSLAGACHRSAGEINFPQLAERGPTTYEARRDYMQVVSFRDAEVFDPATYFYQQRYNRFATDGAPRVRDVLHARGFDAAGSGSAMIERLGLTDLLDFECVKLSSGQSRRLMIALALVRDPELLVLDNPHIGLDAATRDDLDAFLNRLADSGLHLIMAASGEDWPDCMTHRLHLEASKIVAAGPVGEVQGSESEEAEGDLNALRNCFPPPTDELSEILFELRDVNVRYGPATVLDQVNWQVRRGEKWSLLGDNGAGKSTLLALLFGDHPQAYANEVHVFGHRRGAGQSIWDVKKHMGFTSSELHQSFGRGLHCLDAALRGLSDTVYRRDPVTELERQRIELLFRYFGVSGLAERPFHAVSTGEQRMVLLIRALGKNPALLLLDEPFQAFDAVAVTRARRLLSEVLSSDHSLVFITHYQDEIPEGMTHNARIQNGVFVS